MALLDGIKWGLILAILIGPIMLSLVQAGIERGLRLGMTLGAGVWVSDLIFIALMYWGVSTFQISPNLFFGVGMVGGIVLIAFGLNSIFSKEVPSQDNVVKAKTYGGYFIKGFIINTINPFTFFFWITVSTTEVTHLAFNDALAFYAGILGTIILTDFSKVVLAKRIRKFLTPTMMVKVRKVAGYAMIVFGIFLMVRVAIAPPEF